MKTFLSDPIMRQMDIIDLLLSNNALFSFEELQNKYNVSRTTLVNNFETINSFSNKLKIISKIKQQIKQIRHQRNVELNISHKKSINTIK